MFKVRVVGTYVARSGVMEKEKIKKNYEIEGNIPTITSALSIVKNKLLGPALSKKYPDYVTFLTYHIIEIEPLDAKSAEKLTKVEVQYMSRSALVRYIKDNALGVNPSYYPSLFKLREAVQYAKEDPKGYAKHFALREPDLRLDLEMAKCNPDLFQNEGMAASVSIPAPKVTSEAARPKVSDADALAVKTEDRLNGLRADQIRDGEMGSIDESVEDFDAGEL